MTTYINDLSGVIGGVAILPSAGTDGSAADGVWIDLGDSDGQVHAIVQLGEASGTPNAYSLAVKLREADKVDGTGKQDMSGVGHEAAEIAEDTPANNDGSVVLLRSPHRSKRYVSVNIDAGFDGGTSPKLPISVYVFAQKRKDSSA